jgi:hypothetical protein
MSNAIFLDPALVPAALRGGYKGKKFKAIVCIETTIPSDIGLWSGGNRDTYSAIDLATGRQIPLPGQLSSPWDSSRADHTVAIKPGFALVRHTLFCGKDLGLTFYLHPDNAARMLPAPCKLTEHESLVLQATASLKSSYNGMDRYDMKARDHRYSPAGTQPFPTREQWEGAKQALIARGLLNKAGAITVAGRNAAAKR